MSDLTNLSDDQLRAMTATARSTDPIRRALAAESILPAHPIAKIAHAIYSQESSSGGNVKDSNAGAKGIMQMLPGTFNQYADKGWNIDNTDHNARAGVRYIADLYKQADGDPVATAAGYYSGPKAIPMARRGIPLRDNSNPNAPNTLEYGHQVAARAGLVGVAGMSNAELADHFGKLKAMAAPISDATNDIAVSTHAGMEHLTSSVPPVALSNEMEAQRTGPEALARYNKYKSLDPVNKLLIGAGTEGLKLLSGTADLANTVHGFVHDRWSTGHPELFSIGANSQGFKDTAERAKWLADKNAEQDINYKEFNQVGGMPSAVGKALPYVIDGMFAGPMAEKLGAKLTDIPLNAVGRVGTEGKGLLTRGVNALANRPPNAGTISDFAKTIGTRLKINVTDPMTDKAIGKPLQRVTPDPLFNSGRLAGSAVLGATEGGLHYDNTMEGGAMSSIEGTLFGSKIEPYLTASKDFRSNQPYQKELIKWYENTQGGRLTPGTKLGDRESQQFEAGMMNSDKFGNPLYNFKMDKMATDNASAYHALGVPREDIGKVTPEFLNNHMVSLKKQYDDLEAGTTGVFNPFDTQVLHSHIASFANDKTKAGQKLYSDLLDYKTRLDPLMTNNTSISGPQFKDIRARLKADIDSAYSATTNRGDALAKANALKLPLKLIEDSVERGVRQGTGTEGVAAWKELSTKYALTKDVLNHGSDKYGNFDPKKWGNHQMATDPERFLTESSKTPPSLITLNRLAKIKNMESDNAGSVLGGMGVHPGSMDAKDTLAAKMIVPKNARMPSLKDRIMLKAYMSGYPANTGLLNMSGVGSGNPLLYTRAMAEQEQAYPKLFNKFNNTRDAFHIGAKKLTDKYIEPYVSPIYNGIYDAINK